MQHKTYTWIAITALVVALGWTMAACSTEELCDRACNAWAYCTQVDGNYVNYPYDTCYDECMADGDWDLGYVNCVESYDTCPEIGNNCG